MAAMYDNWVPPVGALTLAAPGFARQWAADEAASVNPSTVNLGNMLNWAQIPGAETAGFLRDGEFGDLPTVNNVALDEWLATNGYKIMDSPAGGDAGYRWVQDAQGNVVGAPSEYSKGTDKMFMAAALAAAGLTGANVLAAGFGASGAGAGAAAGGGGASGAGAGGAASGAGAAADPLGAYLTTGGVDGSLGALSSATPLNMAAIESGLGTAGYGANAAAASSGLFNPATIGAGATSGGFLSTVGDILSKVPENAAKGFTDWLTKLTSGGKGTFEGITDLMKLYGLYESVAGKDSGGGRGGAASLSDLRAMIGQPNREWSPSQRADAQRYFSSPLTLLPGQAPPPASPLTQYQSYANPVRRFGVDPMNPEYRRYAEGGDVSPLSRIASDVVAAHHGPGYVAGGRGGGQDDLVEARLSPGEYVFDADVVSALGDGSNEAGARRLDAMRERIRAHKRAAPHDKIPPRAHDPEHYLKRKG